MSVAVEMDELRAEVSRFGDRPYLLTVSDDARPHAVAVHVAWEGDWLVLTGGRKTAENATARPSVTLLWPPIEAGGFSLIADGEASVTGSRISFRPETAVLHRSLAGAGFEGGSEGASGHASGEGSGGSECVGVLRH